MNRRATITSPRRMLAAMVAGIPAPCNQPEFAIA
jgi:hypothetical protein